MFSKKLMDKINEYDRFFGDDNNFPTIPLCMGRTEEEVIVLIDRCLQVKKDVYELGILSDDLEIKY